MFGFYSHRTNLHKHPQVSRVLCWMGRHDYEVVSTDETGATLECFYCYHRKHSRAYEDPAAPSGSEPGPTGRYPKGKVCEDDRGELKVAVGHTAEGKILLDFGTYLSWVAMDPEEARALISFLRDHARAAEALKK